ncbi:MAG: cyclic-di-AMP receptor [Firmicutes bacterium]|nr:cyclic-di-AMP receptor [Bacillota bacterium]MDI6824475.1 cyclic-di-AMP receptor [Bacillota bacterium]MDI7249216.1 cyclic-di-AMP receptor [Bacillota bacterium]
MKLIVAVIQDKDAVRLLEALIKKGYRATKLASTGGFLREGNTTVLIGVEDGETDEVLGTIRETCRPREQLVTPLTPMSGPADSYVAYPVEVVVGGATVFVLNVERYEKI